MTCNGHMTVGGHFRGHLHVKTCLVKIQVLLKFVHGFIHFTCYKVPG